MHGAKRAASTDSHLPAQALSVARQSIKRLQLAAPWNKPAAAQDHTPTSQHTSPRPPCSRREMGGWMDSASLPYRGLFQARGGTIRAQLSSLHPAHPDSPAMAHNPASIWEYVECVWLMAGLSSLNWQVQVRHTG